MTALQYTEYRESFKKLDPLESGYLSGSKGVAYLRRTNLADATLRKIWNLTDLDRDGRLTCTEFCLTVHAIKCLQERGYSLPSSLPPSLIESANRHASELTVKPEPIEPRLAAQALRPPVVDSGSPGSPDLNVLIGSQAMQFFSSGMKLFKNDPESMLQAMNTYTSFTRPDIETKVLLCLYS